MCNIVAKRCKPLEWYASNSSLIFLLSFIGKGTANTFSMQSCLHSKDKSHITTSSVYKLFIFKVLTRFLACCQWLVPASLLLMSYLHVTIPECSILCFQLCYQTLLPINIKSTKDSPILSFFFVLFISRVLLTFKLKKPAYILFFYICYYLIINPSIYLSIHLSPISVILLKRKFKRSPFSLAQTI